VKRLIALAVGLFGLRAYLKRRRRTVEPADELRDRLAAQRTATAETSSVPVEEPPTPVEEPEPADEPPAPAEEPEPVAEADEPRSGADVDARRAEVHARARKKIDELSS